MLTKLTLGENFKDLRIEKGYKSTEQLASVVNIPKTTDLLKEQNLISAC